MPPVPHRPPGIVLTSGAATHVGHVRTLNEDAFLEAGGAYVVADGMGGHQAGEVASAIVVATIEELAARSIPSIEMAPELVRAANEAVRAEAAASGRVGMGSTLVGLFLMKNGDEESLVVVNVGDSRCYVLSRDELRQVTKDHSYVQDLVDRGEVTAEEASHHPERNVVTRAIGIEPVVAGDFHLLPHAVMRVLLCSDGVSSELSSEQIRQILAEPSTPREAAVALIDAVLTGRAADNATALVVDVDVDVDETELPAAGGSGRAEDITAPVPVRVDTELGTTLITGVPLSVLVPTPQTEPLVTAVIEEDVESATVIDEVLR